MSKWHNVKTRKDGYTFDSLDEAARYGDLKIFEWAGEITERFSYRRREMEEAKKQHYETFAVALTELCKEFGVANLQASIWDSILVVQFRPRGEVVAYDRRGKPTIIASDMAAWMGQQLRGVNG